MDSALDARGHFEGDLTRGGADLDAGALPRFAERDGQVEVQVVTLAAEVRVLAHADSEHEVARLEAAARRALPTQPDLAAVRHTGRNANAYVSALGPLLQRQLLLHARERFVEADGDLALLVGRLAARARSKTATATTAPEELVDVAAEQVFEGSTEAWSASSGLTAHEDFFEASEAATATGIPHGSRRVGIEAVAQPDLAEVVVQAALAVVLQDVVRVRDALEPLLGLGVVGIAVRVKLTRKLAVGLLDFVPGGALLEPQFRV